MGQRGLNATSGTSQNGAGGGGGGTFVWDPFYDDQPLIAAGTTGWKGGEGEGKYIEL